MSILSIEDRITIMEFVAEIASEAAQNTNVISMIEFQEELVERLYRKMTALIEEGGVGYDEDDDADFTDAGDD